MSTTANNIAARELSNQTASAPQLAEPSGERSKLVQLSKSEAEQKEFALNENTKPTMGSPANPLVDHVESTQSDSDSVEISKSAIDATHAEASGADRDPEMRDADPETADADPETADTDALAVQYSDVDLSNEPKDSIASVTTPELTSPDPTDVTDSRFQESPQRSSENYVLDFSNKNVKLMLPTLPFLTQTGNFSCSTWFRVDGDPKNSYHTLFEHSASGTNRFGFRVVTGSGGGRIHALRYDGSSIAVRSNRGGFNAGQWTHAVMLCFGGRLSIYVNGIEVTEVTEGGALGPLSQIGERATGNVKSEHRQGDTRFYDRVLSADEIREIYRAGRRDDRKTPDSAGDYAARWHPDQISIKKIKDLSGNGYDLTLSYGDRTLFVVDEPAPTHGIRRLFAVGNSLTADASPAVLAPQSDRVINSGQSMIFHAATPSMSTDSRSFLWGKALAMENYDVLMLQPFPTRPAQNIAAEVAAMQMLIDKQPHAIVLVHEGWAPASVVSRGKEIDAEDDGKIRYSNACFEKIVRKLRSENPDADIRRSRTNEAVHLVAADLAKGDAVGITAIGVAFGPTELYRDGLHINYTHGRYLIHHCIRRALGITKKRRDFPFVNHPKFGSADTATLDYLDTVIDRVFADSP